MTDVTRYYAELSKLSRRDREMDADKEKQLEALRKLREPFPENQVSLLPKPTRAQTDEVKRPKPPEGSE